MVVSVAEHMIGSLWLVHGLLVAWFLPRTEEDQQHLWQKQPMSSPEQVYVQFWLPSVYLPTSDTDLTYLPFALLYT